MRIAMTLAAAAILAFAACGPDEPHLSYIDTALNDSAHFELRTPAGSDEISALTARFQWRDDAGALVADRVVELTPDSGGYHRVISPEATPDIVVRAVPVGATEVEAELQSLRYADGTVWNPGS